MELKSYKISVILVVLLHCFCSDFVSSIDTITSSQFIRDNETITSAGSNFKLGFFSPDKYSTDRYVGIWYTDSPLGEFVIWVANRNKPLNDSSGIITISDDGNLVVLNGQKQVLWSSNASNSVTKAGAQAQLLRSGNLVLHDNTSRVTTWESFREPTDTLMSTMKLSTNLTTGEKMKLTSWKSSSDPSIGSFSFGIDPLNIPQVFIWKDNRPYWRSAPWNGEIFMGAPNMYSAYNDGFKFVADYKRGTIYLSFAFAAGPLSYFNLNSEGQIVHTDAFVGKEGWGVSLWALETECDVYGKCGEYGSCSSQKKPICSCLRGFKPNNTEEWKRGNWTSGCIRRRALQYEKGKEDEFSKMRMMKVPDFAERSSGTRGKCREECLKNGSCLAYAFDASISCMIWRRNLIDTQQFYNDRPGINLYIRVAHSEFDKKDMRVIIIVLPVIAGIFIIASCTFFSWRWITKCKGTK